MNQSVFLHVVQRLESLVGKLPATIQKPILSELTPLKELFLQQRSPRLLFSGSDKFPIAEVIKPIFPDALFPATAAVEIYSWKELHLPDRGTISFLDARAADDANAAQVEEELNRESADMIVFLDDCESSRGPRKIDIDNLRKCSALAGTAKIIAIALGTPKRKQAPSECASRLRSALEADKSIHGRLIDVFQFDPGEATAGEAKRLLSILARHLPNEARIEMIRIAQDKDAQHEVAQVLIKSTTAICTAIGAQPIPLADLPILTTLQLVMVSGIMYLSGRERSLRAATEFVGALGVNLGAGILFREGARAILKFFPGWGNVVSGMVAGAGTYAIGRAASVFFLEGVSLKDARRTYLASRKKAPRAQLPGPRRAGSRPVP